MDDDLHERFGELLKEVPEAEDALREWRDQKAKDSIRRSLYARRTEILVKSFGGYEPPGGEG